MVCNLYILKCIIGCMSKKGFHVSFLFKFMKTLRMLKYNLYIKNLFKKIRIFKKKKKSRFIRKRNWKKFKKYYKYLVIKRPLYLFFLVFKKIEPSYRTFVFYKSGKKYIFPQYVNLLKRCGLFFSKLLNNSFQRNEKFLYLRLTNELVDTYKKKSITYKSFRELKTRIDANMPLLYLRQGFKYRKKKKKEDLIDLEGQKLNNWFIFIKKAPDPINLFNEEN